jgi:hypothetical protein
MNKRWTLEVEVRVASRHAGMVNPIKTDLEFAGWGAPVEVIEGAVTTYLVYNLEVEADGRTVREQVMDRYGRRESVERVSNPDPDSGSGTHESHLAALRKGERKPPVRMEHRKRRGKNKTDR